MKSFGLAYCISMETKIEVPILAVAVSPQFICIQYENLVRINEKKKRKLRNQPLPQFRRMRVERTIS